MAEGSDTKGDQGGKNKKPGLLGGGPSAVEHPPYWNSAGTLTGRLQKPTENLAIQAGLPSSQLSDVYFLFLSF